MSMEVYMTNTKQKYLYLELRVKTYEHNYMIIDTYFANRFTKKDFTEAYAHLKNLQCNLDYLGIKTYITLTQS